VFSLGFLSAAEFGEAIELSVLRAWRFMMQLKILYSTLSMVAIAGFATNVQAAQFTYVSQIGTLDADGHNPSLTSTTLSQPLSGVSNLSEVLLATQTSGPDSYEGRAELATSLGANSLFIDGYTSGAVQGCDPYTDIGCAAGGSVDVTIDFALDISATLKAAISQSAFTSNDAFVTLTHLDIGFEVGFWNSMVLEIPTCGSLPASICYTELPKLDDPSGGTLPAGNYRLNYSVYAFTVSGSCAVGCGSAGSSFELTVVPEPSTGLLVGFGLLGLARSRRG
jgi:hypothetical protein